jgi:hypothetical protein
MAARPPWSRVAPAGPMYRVNYYSPGSLTVPNGQNTGTVSYSVFGLQWNAPGMVMQLTEVSVQWTISTTMSTITDVPFGLFGIRAMTAAFSGGTAVTFTATQNIYTGRLDTNFAATQFATVGDMRIATTGNLTACTGNIDAYPSRVWMGNSGALGIIGGTSGNPFSFPQKFGDQPNTQSIFLRPGEGISIQPLATLGTAGVLNFCVGLEWIEMSANFS